MLARANRLVRAEDYRNAVRRGRRSGTGNTVVYVIRRSGETSPRFGFIVSKAVGNAVIRNTIRRRLKSVCLSLIGEVSADTDMVIRALPSAKDASWWQLRDEVAGVMAKGAQA